MKNISRISQHKHEKVKTRDKSTSARKGFTLVEIMVAVAIIGIMAFIFYPNIIGGMGGDIKFIIKIISEDDEILAFLTDNNSDSKKKEIMRLRR